jgi:hypothetical protein
MQVFKDGRVAHYKDLFPNTSFPAGGPTDSFLASHGAYKVSVFRDHNRATQKLVPCSPVVENGFAYVVEVVDKTEEEIAADVATKAAQVRAARDWALTASDWTQVADAPVDKAAWATYRQALRDLPDAEGFPDVELPHDPDWVDPNQQGE